MANNETAVDFRPLVEAVNRNFYEEGQIDRAFVHWGMKLIMSAFELTQESMKDQTLIGGKGDCGVDGWYLEDDQDPPTLYLFQGKFGAGNLTEGQIDELWRAPENLLSSTREKNELASQLARELTNLARNGVSLQLNFMTTCRVAGTGETRAIDLSNEKSKSLQIEDQAVGVPVEFKLWDTEKLQELYESYLMAGSEQTPEFHINFAAAAGEGGRFIEVATADGRTISFLAPASELADIFVGPPKRWFLFKENPRGPLQRYNKRILQTLEEPTSRARFHTLNNGLSIVCQGYELDRDKRGLTIRGMRIVNGCQTTVTLGKAHEKNWLDASVLVIVRLTETADGLYRKRIAEANNTQKAVRSADLASLQVELRHYNELFANLSPPYHLETQAGDWDYMMTRDDRSLFGDRHIEREALAQANLAFRGKPSEALEDRKSIFQKRFGPDGEDPRGHFEEVFERGVRAEVLLLPWIVMRKVDDKLEEAGQRVGSTDEGGTANPLDRPEYTRYSRLHRTWLIAELLSHYFQKDFSRASLDAKISWTLCDRIEDWFDSLYAVANETVYDAMDSIKDKVGDAFESRLIFRSSHRSVKTPSGVTIGPRQIFLDRLEIVRQRSDYPAKVRKALDRVLA